MKNMLYTISIISLCIYSILTIEMLPFIFASSWQGIFYLVITIALFIVELDLIIKDSSFLKKSYIYNVTIVFITMYLGTIYYIIYTTIDSGHSNLVSYFKAELLLISLFMIIVFVCLDLSHKKSKKS